MPNIGDIMREAAYDSQFANYRSGGNRLNAWGGIVNALGGFMTDMAGYFERKRQYEEGKEFEREQFEWKKGVTSRQESREERAEGRAAERHGPEMELLKIDKDYRKSLLTKLEGELEDIEADKATKKLVYGYAASVPVKDLRSMDKMREHLMGFQKTLPEKYQHMAGAAIRDFTQSMQIYAPANIKTGPDIQSEMRMASLEAKILRGQAMATQDPVERRRLLDDASKAEAVPLSILSSAEFGAQLEAAAEEGDDALIELARTTAKNSGGLPEEAGGGEVIMRFLTAEHEGLEEPILGGKTRGEDISGYGKVLKQWVANELKAGNRDAIFAMRYLDKDDKINIRKLDEGMNIDAMLKRAQILEQMYGGDIGKAIEDLTEYGSFAGWSPQPAMAPKTGFRSDAEVPQIARSGMNTVYREPKRYMPIESGAPEAALFETIPQQDVTMQPQDAARLAIRQALLSAQGQQLQLKPRYSDTLKANTLTVDEFIKLRDALLKKPAGQ